MITKERFLELAEKCFIDKKTYMEKVNIAIESGLIDLEKEEPNFSAVYPVATAIYEKETSWYITGSSDESWMRRARRKATELRSMFYHPIYYIKDFYERHPKYIG